ncbi:Pentatricopeptide repeat-containing protein [Seminavis robusta]|uniref:Pentatricopeptide repeat-containing protein n=1 Tax=Seminavis robusta TaxID=568900 RepID=A0A9N8E0M1_9STRA|nr:Pentatricopeptide repeat-containing protein [Seminavis robusta]|eukprot:Sro443_g144030.1 Pentatricopeptide repeat-containing protein (869) ;mRNA; f:24918-27524
MIRSILRQNFKGQRLQVHVTQSCRRRRLTVRGPLHLERGETTNSSYSQSAAFFSSSYYDYGEQSAAEDVGLINKPTDETLLEEEDDSNNNGDDGTGTSQTGEMSVDKFLDMEDELNDFVQSQSWRTSRDNIDHSLRLLSKMVREYEANPQLWEEHDLKHWAGGRYPRCAKLLDEILTNWMNWWPENRHRAQDIGPKTMYDLVNNLSSGSPPLQLTDKTYSILVSAASKGASDPRTVPMFAEKMLDHVLEESTKNPLLRPSNIFFNAVLAAWSRSGLPEAAERVESLFNSMCSLYEDGILDHPPDDASYVARMQAASIGRDREVPHRVTAILDEMKEFPFERVEPNTAAYRMAIHAWIHSKEPQSTQKAYTLFVEIVRKYMSTRDEQVLIDTDLFSIMISTLAKAKESEKAEEIFELLKELRDSTGDHRFDPSTKVLLGMIIAHRYSRQAGSSEKAHAILLHLEASRGFIPKRSYYVDVLKALIECKTESSLDRAEQLLARMVHHQSKNKATNMLFDKQLHDQVVLAWSRNTKVRDAPVRAERLLQTMHDVSKQLKNDKIGPDEQTYSHVMAAWRRSQDSSAPDRAEKLFLQMLQRYDRGDVRMKPNLMHYTTLIATVARSSQPDVPARAQTLFDDAISRYEATGDKTWQPDSYLYNAMMVVYRNVGNAVAAEKLFLELYESYVDSRDTNLMPSSRCFNTLLEAWINSNSPESHDKAKFLFDSMVEFSEEDLLNVPPDGHTFKLMIDMVASSGQDDAAEQADKYLELLKAAPILENQLGHGKIFASYLSVIGAWCTGKTDNDKAMARAEVLVAELIGLAQSGKIPHPTRTEYARFASIVSESKLPEKYSRAVSALQGGGKDLRQEDGEL